MKATMDHPRIALLLGFLLFPPLGPTAAAESPQVTAVLSKGLGPLHIDRMALGQGGLSEEPMWDGLFDFQDKVRPAYFAFKLLSRLTGERLELSSSHPTVRGFMTRDDSYTTYRYNLLLWSFSPDSAEVEVRLESPPGDLAGRSVTLDAATPRDDENARLRPGEPVLIEEEDPRLRISLDPYGIRFWSFQAR